MVEFSDYHKVNDWRGALQSLSPLFGYIRPDFPWATRDQVRQTSKTCMEFLEQDLKNLQSEAGFIFSSQETDDHTDQTVELIRRWHIGGRSPSLAALAVFALENLQPVLTPDIAKAVLTAGVLGEVPNNLPYHNNMHYRKVMLQLIRMLALHNNIYEGTDQTLDGRQTGLLLIAASMHDLGHDGKGNTIKGVFEAGRLEKQSFELAEPYFEACGMNKDDLRTLKTMLLCTDVAPIGDPANPVNQMKSAYRYHFLGQKRKVGSLNLDPDLAALEKDPKLTMMCVVLHESDISTSAGLDYALTTYETGLYKAEMGQAQSHPQDVLDFLQDICQRQMLSDAAQRLYAANMARIFALAERDIEDGNGPYPLPEHSDFLLLHRTGQGGSSKTIN